MRYRESSERAYFAAVPEADPQDTPTDRNVL